MEYNQDEKYSIELILQDCRSGVSNFDIQQKYDISYYSLRKILYENGIVKRGKYKGNKSGIGKLSTRPSEEIQQEEIQQEEIQQEEIQPENNKEIKQGFNIEEYETVETEKQRKFYGLNK